MRTTPTCPRCGGPVHEPSAWSSAWQCGLHGAVHPVRTSSVSSAERLSGLARGAVVPVWLPWPIPAGWLVTGFARAGDGRSGTRGCAVALSGPNPVGGPGEMLVIAEEPGVGLGARFAGLDGPDPGDDVAAGCPDALVRFNHHEFPLWHVQVPERAAFVGEAMGSWLWLILWPATAGVLLAEHLELLDLRDPGVRLDLPFGAPSPLLPG